MPLITENRAALRPGAGQYDGVADLLWDDVKCFFDPDAIPPVRGRVGRSRRGTLHGTRLGAYRWVVERSFAWLQGLRRLRIRRERRADIHAAFLKLACCLITHRQLRTSS
jgi:hypothetical protein